MKSDSSDWGWLLASLLAVILSTHFIVKFSSPDNLLELGTVLSFNDQCQTVSGRHSDHLILVLDDESMARHLMKQLCEDRQVSKQFGTVKAYWQQNEKEVFEFVGQGTADLVLIKDNFITAFDSDLTYGYREIASYQDYSAFLIANKEKPVLDKEYLMGKRVGLLDYPSSRSGHIAPMRLFKQLGLDDSLIKISYLKSHEQLRLALSRGDVDIISSYWSDSDNDYFPESYRVTLEEQISGSKWYLRAAATNTELKCAVQNVLTNMSERFEGYYGNLILSEGCSKSEQSS